MTDGSLPPTSNIWTGDWYRRTLQAEKLRLLNKNVRLLPVALFVDKTNLDKLGRTQACPITAALLNYVQDVVAADSSKKLFGYYPDVKLTKEQKKMPAVKKMLKDLYHHVTDKMLDGLVELYDAGGVQWADSSGEVWHLVPVVAFVATDVQEAQWMKGVYQGASCRLPCHLCELPYDLFDVVIPNHGLIYR